MLSHRILNKHITNLYQGLSNKEKAVLSFEASKTNSNEFSRIKNSVKSEIVEMKEHEYRSWLIKLNIFSSTWSMLHFKENEKYLVAMAVFYSGEAEEDATEEQQSAVFIQIQQQKARLCAIDNALEHLCNKHGLSTESVRKYADIEIFFTADEASPDIEYQNQLIEMFDQEIFLYAPIN